MTQAIALSNMLQNHGHAIVHAFIGKSKRRSVPNYFYEQINSTVSEINSPNFILDKKNKSLKLGKSISYNARFLGTYKKSLDQIHQKVRQEKPDVLVNFYDFLGGFYFRLYKPTGIKHVCIGRQFLTLHPDYPYAPGREAEKKLYLINNKITSLKCDKYLALSFRPYDPLKIGKLVVVPPLLNSGIKDIKTSYRGFLLGYMVNDGYAEELISWHANNPETVIHCFWDRKNTPPSYSPQRNLTFHHIDAKLFSEMMRKCEGYISTAGFESICEAMYLQKPVQMIPVKGQYEQACNAVDAEMSGAGIKAENFNATMLLELIPKYVANNDFRSWVDRSESIFLAELTYFS